MGKQCSHGCTRDGSQNIMVTTCDQSGLVQRHCCQQSLSRTVVGRMGRGGAGGTSGAAGDGTCRTSRGMERASGRVPMSERWRRETEEAQEGDRDLGLHQVLVAAEVVGRSSAGRT